MLNLYIVHCTLVNWLQSACVDKHDAKVTEGKKIWELTNYLNLYRFITFRLYNIVS